jgi:thiol:disulfide interchange protein DsbD
MVIAGGLLFANNLRNKGMEWETYSDEALLKASENGVPVLLDFYADWCIPCLELDRSTWTDAEVLRETKGLKKFKVDLTHFDTPEAESLRKKFNVSGVPTIILIRADGKESMEARSVGYISAKEFLDKLKQTI